MFSNLCSIFLKGLYSFSVENRANASLMLCFAVTLYVNFMLFDAQLCFVATSNNRTVYCSRLSVAMSFRPSKGDIFQLGPKKSQHSYCSNENRIK